MNNTTHLPNKTQPQISPQESDITSIQHQIANHKRHMEEQEISDDGYYISRQYTEDKLLLYKLEQLLQLYQGHTA